MRPPRIAHIITDLNGFGGTEATLLRYLTKTKFRPECHRVVVLRTTGAGNTIGARMAAAGVYVVALNQVRGWLSPRCLWRVYRELREFEPDVISGWLYHPSLVASAVAPLLRCRPSVIWHIRCLTFSSILRSPNRFIVQRLLSVLSYLANPRLVTNSDAAIQEHRNIGFRAPAERVTVIPNGIDVDEYCPDPVVAMAIRGELGIPADAFVVGCIGRFVPEKGYPYLFESVDRVTRRLNPALGSRVHVVAAGHGVTASNDAIRRLLPASLPMARVHLLGKRADVPRVLNALNVFVSPSISEAFPNALVEAMATGLACITTDIGECREALSMAEFVVPPGAPEPLANCILALATMTEKQRQAIGYANRQRVIEKYELLEMVRHFDAMFESAATDRRPVVIY